MNLKEWKLKEIKTSSSADDDQKLYKTSVFNILSSKF